VYDIIGDIHGEVDCLRELLLKLGYSEGEHGFSHPTRKAVFVGDYVDRGPAIIETLDLVKQMCDTENAYAIVGNHEINLLAYYTKDKDGFPLRERSAKNKAQLKRTILEFKEDKTLKKKYLNWLRSLPLFLEFDDFRIVHAAWDQKAVDLLKEHHSENCMSKKFMRKIYTEKGDLFDACMLLCKGREFNLPKDMLIKDLYGIKRMAYRIKWWEAMEGKSFQEVSFGNRFQLPNYTIPKELYVPIPDYSEKELPVFFGHYCRSGASAVIRENLCCVDACVANGGSLLAYRWNGEKCLQEGNVIKIEKRKIDQ